MWDVTLLDARTKRNRAALALGATLVLGALVLCRPRLSIDRAAPFVSGPTWQAPCFSRDGEPLAIDVRLNITATEALLSSAGAMRAHVERMLRDAGWGAGVLGSGQVQPLFTRTWLEMAADRAAATRLSGESCPDLSSWWRLTLPRSARAMTRGAVDAMLARLHADPRVGVVSVEPRAEPAVLEAAPRAGRLAGAPRGQDGDTCPIDTPAYDARQGYLGKAPGGIDAPSAWAQRGGRGEDVRIADVEGGWNQRHEDLPGDRMEDVGGRHFKDRGWEMHGTAVIGVVASKDNGLGMIGIAPDVSRIFTSSISQIGVAGAIDRAASRLRAGDVLIIELHGPGPRSHPGGGQKGYLPMEWWPAAFDAIQLHARRGVVIVEAGGNGGENLDDPIYGGAFDRARRDSGAILVGAGAPPATGLVDRSRLEFSNYGSRLDLQGWGLRVATLDYGDLQGCEDTARKYTALFSGTSSASPVVAGAVACLEGIARARAGTALDPAMVRDILSQTGSPQTDGPAGPRAQRIGPRPDLARASHRLAAVLAAMGR